MHILLVCKILTMILFKDVHLFSGLLLISLGHEGSDVNLICAGIS